MSGRVEMLTVELCPDEADDAVWMAKLARGASWPGEMAQRVQDAADRTIAACDWRTRGTTDARNEKALRHDLAATFDSHLNRGQTYTGAQVAAMLRDGGE